MNFKEFLNESSNLYIMLCCADGTYAGCDNTSSIWDFVMSKIDRYGLDRYGLMNNNYYFYVKYADGEEFVAKRQQKLFQVIRDFRNPSVFNHFKQSIQRNYNIYIECVTGTMSFRIGTADTFNIFDEDDNRVNIEDIAGNGIRKLKGYWFDQIF